MGKKKKHHQQPQLPSRTVFTVATVRLLKQALRTYEKSLVQQPATLPNIALAKETVAQLKTKLEDILQRRGWETVLYYNDVYILYTAVQLHLIQLCDSPQGEKVLEQCLRLCQQFSAMISSANEQENKEYKRMND
ncbi:MAG: hypothetical protein JO202_04575 [Ktedonobacteraceae bacterium]|nr:hypothetical protein [Ktedonobacteraceae bacterium]